MWFTASLALQAGAQIGDGVKPVSANAGTERGDFLPARHSGGRLRGIRGALLAALPLAALVASAAEVAPRQIPAPLPAHPGNVFLAGEDVRVPAPEGAVTAWSLRSYEGRELRSGAVLEGRAAPGPLPVGWYELVWRDAVGVSRRTNSLGVLARLRAPTPRSSPIALDVAASWFYKEDQIAAAANLCALAGVNWVRDRLHWREIEPERERFATDTRYDAAARIQSAAGLQVLQVNHISPAWANADTKRFPEDLRDAWRFHREIARRWRGQVAAFEPWNEADIPMFGGHTGAEMAAMQKASFLGLKAGNPAAIACWNVFAHHRASTLRDLAENEAWPWFDTYNLHHYEPFEAYPKLYADHRAVSAGRPLWVTECALPVKWAGDEAAKEPTVADLRVQAERVAKTYALALHERASMVFSFLLPHYVEGQTQFGIVRPDLTPRPAFVALAAVGRLLADAAPLGRLKTGEPEVRAYAFAAQPDGEARTVIVAWTTREQGTLPLPQAPAAMFDHLGQPMVTAGSEVALSAAPRFVLLRRAEGLALEPPPPLPPRLAGASDVIVLQPHMPVARVDVNASAYRVETNQVETLNVFAYNFGEQTVRGRLRVEAPAAWKADCPDAVDLAPGERKALAVKLTFPTPPDPDKERLRLTADFGRGQPAAMSVRFCLAGAEKERR